MEIIHYCVLSLLECVSVGVNAYLLTYDHGNVFVSVSMLDSNQKHEPQSKLFRKFPPLIFLLPADCKEYEISFIYYHITAPNPQEPNFDFCTGKPWLSAVVKL